MMRRTSEILKIHAPRFFSEPEAFRLLDTEVDRCAALLDSEAESFPPKRHSHLQDQIIALGLKVRALKSGRSLLTVPVAGLSKRPEMIKALAAVVEECAALCDGEADSFGESAQSHEEDTNYNEAKLHFQIRDRLASLAARIRALSRTS